MLERAGNKGLISEMTFAEISRAYPQVLTFDTFLEFAIKNKKDLLVETKHPVLSGNRVEELLVKALEESGALSKISVSIMSFSWSAIEKVKRLNPEISTTLLLHKHTPWFQVKYSSAISIGPEIEHLRAEPIRAAKIKELGRSLHVWTVDEDSDIKLCQRLGVDILITNKPAHVREVLRYP
jgi:glycerophosphoryl diester phosphodiesterase